MTPAERVHEPSDQDEEQAPRSEPGTVDGFPNKEAAGYLAVANARLDHQTARIDALDAKAVGVLQTALAEAGFLLAIIAIKTSQAVALSAWVAVVLTAAACLGTVGFAGAALWVQNWQVYPSPSRTWVVAWGSTPLDWDLARSLETAYDDNMQKVDKKADRVGWAVILLAVTTVLAVVASALVIIVVP